jgi:hypothetical protein
MIEWIFIAAVTVTALLLFAATFGSLKKARTIENIPTSRIRSAHQGYVELLGVASAVQEQPVYAELTGTACVWYDYKIERYQGGKSSHWTVVEKGSSSDLFQLYDSTGECLIDPRHSDVSTSHSKTWSGYDRHPGRPQEISLMGRLRRQRYRYTERRIHQDQPLYAIGWFQTIHAKSAAEQTEDYKSALLAKWKKDQTKMLGDFDRDGNGIIDQAEWESARRQASQQAASYIALNYDPKDVHVLAKPPSNQAFILSTKDPSQLSTHYRKKAFGLLSTSLLIAGFGSWFALKHL